MNLMKQIRMLAIGTAMVLTLISCGGSGTSDTTNQGEQSTTTMDMDSHEEFAFGGPGDPAEADVSIDIEAKDDLTFDPKELTVSAGQTVTFRITNTGSIPHEFTLGDEETQDEHEAEMQEMVKSGEMMMHDELNAVNLEAGEVKELTWKFTEGGQVLFGCHQPGHYAGGMKGSVTVDS